MLEVGVGDSALPFPALAGPALEATLSLASGRGRWQRLRWPQNHPWGTKVSPSLQRPQTWVFSLPKAEPHLGRRKLDAGRPKAPKKQVTHRLMAISLDHTIHDAPVCGLGL